jgi:CheY-like chemotaxis protein
MMPGRTGAEFIASTRIKCVALTAYWDATRIVDELHTAGAVAVCSKPFRLDDLMTVIDTQLGRTSAAEGNKPA